MDGHHSSSKIKHTPETWRKTVQSILTDMGIHEADVEGVNLLSLIVQQEACSVIRDCLDQARSANRAKAAEGDARVACSNYMESYFTHPQLYENNLRGLSNVINAQPIPDTFENPQLCTNLNLSSPAWRLQSVNCHTDSIPTTKNPESKQQSNSSVE